VLSLLDAMAAEDLQPSNENAKVAMRACVRAEVWEEALLLSSELVRQGVLFDQEVYSSLIRACGQGQRLEEGLDIFEGVARDVGTPSVRTYHAVIYACGMCQRWATALHYFDRLREHVDELGPGNFNSILSAVSGHNSDMERQLFQEVLDADLFPELYHRESGRLLDLQGCSTGVALVALRWFLEERIPELEGHSPSSTYEVDLGEEHSPVWRIFHQKMREEVLEELERMGIPWTHPKLEDGSLNDRLIVVRAEELLSFSGPQAKPASPNRAPRRRKATPSKKRQGAR